MSLIFLSLIIALGLNLFMFFIAFKLKTDVLTDISYALTFVIIALLLFFSSNYTLGKLILLIIILVWAIRLGSFLFKRIRKIKRDKRFDKIRSNFLKFFGFWFLQGITVWLVLLSTILYFTTEFSPLNLISFIGLCVWIIGFYFESVSDYQKYKFRLNPKNKGKFITSGLWKYSRHPNYFGEFMIWLGIYTFTLSSLNIKILVFGLISPLYILILLLFISGIPGLEEIYEKKFGKTRAWKNYKIKTSIFIPWFVKK